jgi:hypothetical protein
MSGQGRILCPLNTRLRQLWRGRRQKTLKKFAEQLPVSSNTPSEYLGVAGATLECSLGTCHPGHGLQRPIEDRSSASESFRS